jgi:hypothetical protein
MRALNGYVARSGMSLSEYAGLVGLTLSELNKYIRKPAPLPIEWRCARLERAANALFDAQDITSANYKALERWSYIEASHRQSL